MKALENENEKVNRICQLLKKEALEPAERQAAIIIQEAKDQADAIILNAERKASEILKKAHLEIEREKKVVQSSLNQGVKQTLELLRQEIKNKIFNPQIKQLIGEKVSNPEIIADIIQALLTGIRKSGISGNIKAYIPKDINPNEITKLLTHEVISALGDSIQIGDFEGGAKVKLVDKEITIELTTDSIKELILEFIQVDLHHYVFNV